MLYYPNINPVAFKFGLLKIHWYGLMYLFGFTLAIFFGLYRAGNPQRHWTTQQVVDLISHVALGLIIGGRLGYMLFYDFPTFISNPLILFEIWQGGMSFHGGFLGVIYTTWIFSRRNHKKWMDVADFVAPLVPMGLAAGRIGNFINGELWGRPTTVPWGMIFPRVDCLPRHPSQLYEFLLEGMLLFVIIWWFSAKIRRQFAVSSLFLLCYGLFRFTAEFFRQPDTQLGFIAFGWMTRGQELSFPMIIVGGVALWWTYQNKKH